MGAFEVDRTRQTHFERIQPARRTHAPLVAWLQAWETEFRAWGDEVVSSLFEMIQKPFGQHRTDGV